MKVVNKDTLRTMIKKIKIINNKEIKIDSLNLF